MIVDNKIMRIPVKIGSKFTGQNTLIDTANGYFWSSMPKLSDNEILIQRALLAKGKRIKPLNVDPRIDCGHVCQTAT